MSKRWTFREDLFLAEYEGIDANFIAEHDLGRSSKGAGARRVKALKDAGVWDKIQDYIKARDVARCHHTLAFSASQEAKMIAAETLRDLGEDLPGAAQQLVALADEQRASAERYLAEYDAQMVSSKAKRIEATQ
jgi:hypothetical protein